VRAFAARYGGYWRARRLQKNISEDSVTNSSEDYIPIRGGRTPSTARHGRRGLAVPAAIAGAGDTAVRRFLEFFAATIRNKNTRMAHGGLLEDQQLPLGQAIAGCG
jgi:hypothetical protein